MSMKLEGHRWWVMAMAVLIGPDAATALAEDKPQPAAAQVEPDRAAEIARSIADLASQDPATRDPATVRLAALGKAARPALAKAAKSDDPEVGARAQALLAKLEIPLAIALSAPTTTIKAGQPLPPVTAEIRNTTERPVTVMTPIDGCDVGWRVVRYSWALTGPDGQDVARKGLGRCGNTNPLTPSDFTELAPGMSLKIEPSKMFLSNPGLYYHATKPGTYRLTLHYAFDPDRRESGLGAEVGKEKFAELLGRTLKAEIVSNVLTIEVKE